MPAPPPQRTGLLVVRAWLEDDRPEALRARITSTVDLSHRDFSVVTAHAPEEIQDAVRAWLAAFLVDADDGGVTTG